MGLSRESLVKGGFAVVARQVVSLPITALAVSVTAVFLTPVDFGVQAILMVVVSLSLIIVDLGLPEALVQSAGRPTHKSLRVINLYRFSSAALLAAILYFLSLPFLEKAQLDPKYLALFVSCSAVAWLQSTRNYLSYRRQRNLQWTTLARVELVEVVLYNIVLMITAYLLRSVACFIIALLARYAASAAILFFLSKEHEDQATDAVSHARLKVLVRFGTQIQAPKILSFLQNLVNPLVIGSVAGLQSVGIINWSTNIMNYPRSPLQPLPAFFFSVSSAHSRSQERPVYMVRLIRISALAMAATSLALSILLPFLVTTVFGEQWSPAVSITTILLLANITYLPTLILRSHISGSGFPEHTARIALVEFILVWIIMGGLSWALGPLGYAVGAVCVSVFSFGLSSWIARQTTYLPLVIKEVVLFVVSATTAFLFGRFVSIVLVASSVWLETLVWMIASFMVFAFLIWLLNPRALSEDVRWCASQGRSVLTGWNDSCATSAIMRRLRFR